MVHELPGLIVEQEDPGKPSGKLKSGGKKLELLTSEEAGWAPSLVMVKMWVLANVSASAAGAKVEAWSVGVDKEGIVGPLAGEGNRSRGWGAAVEIVDL